MRVILLLALNLIATNVFADEPEASPTQIYIEVGQAQVKKSLLALPPLNYIGTQTTNPAHIKAGQDVYRVLLNDLAVSNYFTMIKPEAFLEDPSKVGLKPAPGEPGGFDFGKWKTIGTDFLIRGAYRVVGTDLKLDIYAYHVPAAKLVMGKSYDVPLKAFEKIAHTFADDLLKALTGKKGMFMSKITASKQEPGSTAKEIYVMDWDGANPLKITSHQTISISPTWSNAGDKVAYTSFAYHKAQKSRNADLFVYDIKTGKRFLLSYKQGLNSGAAFLPGDDAVLLTLSKEGTADIFRLTDDGKTYTEITKGPNRAMNVEPAISPDGKKIAFSSDRSGRPMVFVMNVDGSNAKRITFEGKFNASPSWSPDGKTLAFAGTEKDHFDIFTVPADGGQIKRLTTATKASGKGANNESPSWSPDGRHILFTSDRTGKYQLYIVAPDGTNERRITNDQASWDKPKWSPFLD